MAQHRIVEVDYHIFIGELRLARDSNKIIEPVNKEKWAEYLASNDVREVSFNAHAKVRFFHGKHQLVAIVRDSEGNLKANQGIQFVFEIRDATGKAVYKEFQTEWIGVQLSSTVLIIKE